MEVGITIKVRKQVASYLAKKMLATHSIGYYGFVSVHANTISAGWLQGSQQFLS